MKVTAQMVDNSESTGTVTVTLETDKGTFEDSGAKTTTLVIPLADDPAKDPATVAPKGNRTAKLVIPDNDCKCRGDGYSDCLGGCLRYGYERDSRRNPNCR